MKRVFFLTLLIVLSLAAKAQDTPFRFRNYSTDDGLPDNSVRAIFQDSDGLIWLCTREGICMYDGLHFKPLEDPSCDILNGLALALAEDRQHRLWFITTRGIGYLDLSTGETRTVHRNASGVVVGAGDIAVDRSGMVWFADEDIYCWDPSAGRLTDYSALAQFRSNTVEADSNGAVWFLSSRGDLYRFQARSSRFERVRDGAGEVFSRQDLVSDGAGHILSSVPGGLVLQTDIFTNASSVRYRTEGGEIRCIVPGPDGSCSLGTDRGLVFLDGDRVRYHTHDRTNPESVAGEDIWSMLRDRQGNLWVGLFYNGLSLLRNPQDLVTRHLGRREGGDLRGSMIRPVITVDDRHILCGAEDGGLSLLDLTDNTVEDLTFPGPEGGTLNIQGLCLEGNDLWIATFGNGVYRMDLPRRRVLKNYLPGLSAACVLNTRVSFTWARPPACTGTTVRRTASTRVPKPAAISSTPCSRIRWATSGSEPTETASGLARPGNSGISPGTTTCRA